MYEQRNKKETTPEEATDDATVLDSLWFFCLEEEIMGYYCHCKEYAA